MTGIERTTEPATVVYIAGFGRSGSTLVERILGALPDYVNVGELIDVFRRTARFDEICGCGEPFSACAFWHGVGQRCFGGWSPELITEVSHLQRVLVRQRQLLRLAAPGRAGRQFQHDLARYGEIFATVYHGILAESGARVVVDASKLPAQALAMAKGGAADVRLVHLVRDARGVAFSWAKSGVERPQAQDTAGEQTMASFRPQATAARWMRMQAEVGASRRLMPESALLRYEDVVDNPARAVSEVMSQLGLPLDAGALQHIDGRAVDLPPSHGLSGNPSRFRSGPQQLRADEQWRHDMARWDRLSTTTIAAAPLTRYRYLPAKARSTS
jgi:Sulfotransferase domain